ncbi:MAG: hypothetical protein R2799_05470 [Crocinitomicaceae bacterium]
MKILGIQHSIWLKSIHVLLACIWFGSVLAVILIYLLTSQSSEELIIRNNSELMEKIDLFIIVPSSVSCYFFGLWISWKTNWGFFKYKWVVFKLIMGSALILFGLFFLGPWILEANSAAELSEFQKIQDKLGVSMIVQAFFITITILVSTIKPWGKVKTN